MIGVALQGAGVPAGEGRGPQGWGAEERTPWVTRAPMPSRPALTVHLRVQALLTREHVLSHLPGLRADVRVLGQSESRG